MVTEDFGLRDTSSAVVLGVAYTDADHDDFYSVGEGLGTLSVTLGATSVTSYATGGYRLYAPATGAKTLTFSGAGLSASLQGLAGFDPLAHALQVHGPNGETDVLVTYDAADTVLFKSTALISLHAADFLAG